MAAYSGALRVRIQRGIEGPHTVGHGWDMTLHRVVGTAQLVACAMVAGIAGAVGVERVVRVAGVAGAAGMVRVAGAVGVVRVAGAVGVVRVAGVAGVVRVATEVGLDEDQGKGKCQEGATFVMTI